MNTGNPKKIIVGLGIACLLAGGVILSDLQASTARGVLEKITQVPPPGGYDEKDQIAVSYPGEKTGRMEGEEQEETNEPTRPTLNDDNNAPKKTIRESGDGEADQQ